MQKIKVWDIVVRLFHWSLFLSVIIQLATAESFHGIHVKVGYFIIGLLVVRIIWGFVGSRHARFADFIYPPKEILAYLAGLVKGRPKNYLGHNPAGGAMVCAVLFFLVLTTLAGLVTVNSHANGALTLSPFHTVATASADSDHHEMQDAEKHNHDHAAVGRHDPFWKEIHETLAGIVIFLGIVHICGVIASSWIHKENLILAMITGNKKTP